jgi:hypothetical protein
VWALAAVLLCLLGSTYAQSGVAAARSSANSQTYVVPLQSHCSQARKVEVSLSPSGTKAAHPAWDVSISIDTTECKMYCTYKRKHNPVFPVALFHLEPMPVATIRVYENRGPATTLYVLDPGGLQSRNAGTYLVFAPPPETANSRSYFAAVLAVLNGSLPLTHALQARALPFDFAAPVAAPVPLRI